MPSTPKRVFPFPTPPIQPTATEPNVQLNALCIGAIFVHENEPGLFSVTLHTTVGTWSTDSFPIEADARSYAALWAQRVEDAHY